MGELFRRNRPETALEWTGERLVSDVAGAIESEHLHRYFLARDLCRGKEVLDVASGEGYGSALLAQTAKAVIGVELDQASVEHADASYKLPNLRYLQGEATRLPLEAASVDMVVSFETLEHFFDHERFFQEIKRVLRPTGFLIVSTPDTHVYSGPNSDPNPFHVRELTSDEFSSELRKEFRHVAMFRQRVLAGSAILPDNGCATREMLMYEQRDAETFESHRRLPHAPYLIAVASQSAVPEVAASLYFQSPKVVEQPKVQIELQRLREVEANSRQQAPIYEQAVKDGAAANEEIQRLKCVLAPLQVELERLRVVELHAREQAPALTRALADHAAVRDQVANLSSSAVALKAEIARLLTVEESARALGPVLEKAIKDLGVAREEGALRAKELAESRQDSEALHQQLNASAALVRQQTLVVQRLQAAAAKPPAEPPPPVETAIVVEPVPEPLPAQAPPPNPPLIPVWARRLVPEPLRPPLRVIKRILRP